MLPRLLAHRRLIAVGAACALAGSAAGIAVSSAATSNNGPQRHVHRFFGPFGDGPGGPGRPGKLGALGVGGRPVHGDFVVPNSAGNGFVTITLDDGKFKSLSGDQLTITEGTQTTTYKTVTLTIPSNATVVRDGQSAKLTDLASGDQVNVIQTPTATHVGAFSANFKQQLKQRFGQFRGEFRGRFGPGQMPPPGGPDAAAPGAPGAPSYQ